jgi:hypothetical protein
MTFATKNDKPEESRSSTERTRTPGSSYPNVDRLMDLASDKKTAGTPSLDRPKDSAFRDSAGPLPQHDPKPPEEKSMWKMLLQLKPFLPYLARLVPLLDIAVGPMQNAALSNEIREAIAASTAKIQAIQRDVNAAAQDQALQSKRLEEEIIRLRDASEKYLAAQASLVEDVQQVNKLVLWSAAGLGVLLVVLIVMTAVLLSRVAH